MLQKLLPTDVNEFWAVAANAIQNIYGSAEMADKIFVGLSAGQLVCHAAIGENGEFYGAIITKEEESYYIGKKTLLLFLLIPGPDKPTSNILLKGFKELRGFAKLVGCDSISAFTTERISRFLQRQGAIERRYVTMEV